MNNRSELIGMMMKPRVWTIRRTITSSAVVPPARFSTLIQTAPLATPMMLMVSLSVTCGAGRITVRLGAPVPNAASNPLWTNLPLFNAAIPAGCRAGPLLRGSSSTPAFALFPFVGSLSPKPWSLGDDFEFELEFGINSLPCPPDMRSRSDGLEEEPEIRELREGPLS